jgi:hypothetical protein
VARQTVTVRGGGGGESAAIVAVCVFGAVGVIAVAAVVALALAVVVALAAAGLVTLLIVGGWRYSQYRAVRDAAVVLWQEDHPDAPPEHMPRRRVVLEVERMRQARYSRPMTTVYGDPRLARRAIGGAP